MPKKAVFSELYIFFSSVSHRSAKARRFRKTRALLIDCHFLFQRFEHLRRVVFGLHTSIGFGDDAVLID